MDFSIGNRLFVFSAIKMDRTIGYRIPKKPDIANYAGRPYEDYLVDLERFSHMIKGIEARSIEKGDKRTFVQNKRTLIKNKDAISLIKTIVLSVSIVVSVYLIGNYYYESNRYWITSYGGVVDKYKGTIKPLVRE